MTPGPADALRALGAIAPGNAGSASAGAVGGDDFAELLRKAEAGELRSGFEVTVGRGAGVELTPSQLERLALAADRAQAQGASRALVLIDGMALELDVLTRQVTGRVDLDREGVLTGIDAVVRVGDAGQGPVRVETFRPPPGVSPSLARALGESDESN